MTRRGLDLAAIKAHTVVGFLRFVEVTETIQCPFCGQFFEIRIDTSVAQQRFTTDCEVCCRPFEVAAECEPGEVLSVEIS